MGHLKGFDHLLLWVLLLPTGCTTARYYYTDAGAGPQAKVRREIQVFDSPPASDYRILGAATVEHPDPEKRLRRAIEITGEKGGDGIIVKGTRSRIVPRTYSVLDVKEAGGFQTRRVEESIPSQDFVIIQLLPTKISEKPAPDFLSGREGSSAPPHGGEPSRNEPLRFVEGRDGTLLDRSTGFRWEGCGGSRSGKAAGCRGNSVARRWEEARTYCETLSLSGIRWRIPTREELLTLATPGKGEGLNRGTLNGMPSLRSDIYWSSSNYGEEGEFATWAVDFSDGSSFVYSKNNRGFVRCISAEPRKTPSSSGASLSGRWAVPGNAISISEEWTDP